MQRNNLFSLFKLFLLIVVLSLTLHAQHVIIVVIDGARYTETFGAESTYIPSMWNILRLQGTLWTNFWNDGITRTQAAHASIETGTWQAPGTGNAAFPTVPTMFEYYRKEMNVPEHRTAIIVGKKKLEMLQYSTAKNYGTQYRAAFYLADDDQSVLQKTLTVLKTHRPAIVLINFPDVDNAGHTGDWNAYIKALRTVDSLVSILWTTIQADSIYRNTTTLFITNDHGRHDDAHGGIKDHGCRCEGCRHCMLLALGRAIPQNRIVTQYRTLIDLAPTVGELLSFSLPTAQGTSLLADIREESHRCGKRSEPCNRCKHSSSTTRKNCCREHTLHGE